VSYTIRCDFDDFNASIADLSRPGVDRVPWKADGTVFVRTMMTLPCRSVKQRSCNVGGLEPNGRDAPFVRGLRWRLSPKVARLEAALIIP
jgi:hypothetical protein